MFRAEQPTISSETRDEADRRFATLKQSLHNRLIQGIDLQALRNMEEAQLRVELRRGAEELCRSRPDLLSAADRKRLVDELVNETLGFGPLEPLLHDASISDILINGPKNVYIERHGRLERSAVTFYDDQHLLSVIQKIVGRVGRRIDESSPMVDARLPDGSRVNAVVKPLALDGALVSIRRFASRPSNPGILVENGTISREMLTFLAACVQARLNLIISGGTGSGKTTLLNLLSGFIRDDERVVTIEDAAELQLRQSHVARMETRASNLEGSGEVTARDLLKNALRMRPDRIVVGECRGAEAFDMLQAMNTGHDGSLTTIHANNAHDALDRLEILVGMASMDVPMWFIGRQIASGVQMVVHVARLTGGQRKVVQISEVTGYDGQHLNIQDIFRFEQTGVDERGMAQGNFAATGIVPKALDRFASLGIPLSASLFALPRKTQPPVMPASSALTTPLSATTAFPVTRGQA